MHEVARQWRWAVMLAVVAVLVALPSIVAAWPVRAASVPPADLVARALGTASTPYQGLALTRGGLGLPDLPGADDVGPLLGGTSRIRVWFAGPTSWRSDLLSAFGERGTYRDAQGSWQWDSERRRAVRTLGEAPLRLPRSFDLVPPELGRRLLAAASPDELTSLPAARVAGRSLPGVRFTPSSSTTVVAHVDVWVDPGSGLPLRVDVVAKGRNQPDLESRFLELSLAAPPSSLLAFDPSGRLRVRRNDAPDVVQAVSRFATLTLPASVAGLPRRAGNGAVAVYGDGVGAVAVLAVPRGLVDRFVPDAIAATKRSWGGEARVLSSTLLNVMAIDGGESGYVVAGAVNVGELDRVAAALVGAPA